MATLTVFPAAASAASGCVQYTVDASSWATIHDAGSGDTTTGSADTSIPIRCRATTVLNHFDRLYRGFTAFDTSALTSAASISAATYSLFGSALNIDTAGTAGIAMVTTSPASNTVLANSDYSQVGSTAQATNITIASWSTSAYNDFTVNGTGLGNISKTATTNFGFRIEKDRANSNTWNSGEDAYIEPFSANQAGTANDPKLVITYTLTATRASLTLVGAS